MINNMSNGNFTILLFTVLLGSCKMLPSLSYQENQEVTVNKQKKLLTVEPHIPPPPKLSRYLRYDGDELGGRAYVEALNDYSSYLNALIDLLSSKYNYEKELELKPCENIDNLRKVTEIDLPAITSVNKDEVINILLDHISQQKKILKQFNEEVCE